VEVGSFVSDITVEGCHLVSLHDFALTLSGYDENTQSKGFYVNNNVIEGSVFAVWAKDITSGSRQSVSFDAGCKNSVSLHWHRPII
jgi:hypothetical protein